MREFKARSVHVPAIVCFLAGMLCASAAAQQETPAQSSASGPGYVGADVCKTCHEDMPSKGFYKNYEDSPHFVTTLDTKKGPQWHGCEACHGPGKEHVEGGGDKSKIFTSKTASAKEIC